MCACTIVISRSAEEIAARRDFEDTLLKTLIACGNANARALVVPSIYCLKAPHPALTALRELDGLMVVASWLHQRAAFWTLHAHGIDGSEQDSSAIRCFNLATFDSPENCAEELLKAAGPTAGPSDEPLRFQDSDGQIQPRWYPVLDYELCVNCKQCHDFCLFGVYDLDADGRVTASTPDACKPGCPACARVCPVGAIMFPYYANDEAIAGAPGAKNADEPARNDDADKTSTHDELDDLIDALDELDV